MVEYLLHYWYSNINPTESEALDDTVYSLCIKMTAYVNAQTMLTCTDTFTRVQLRSLLHIQGFLRLSSESCVLNELIAGEQVVSVYLQQMISVMID